MICNAAGVVILLSVCGIVASSPGRRIDCRKFVFAAQCRGVAAKRGGSDAWYNEPAAVAEEKRFRNMLRSLDFAIKTEKEGGEQGAELEPREQEDADNTIKGSRRGWGNCFLKLLRGSRIPSETDNVPVEEFQNL